jgi:hypothetical protein
MEYEVIPDLTVRGSHVVASANGRYDEPAMKAYAARKAAQYGIGSPTVQIITLNAAQRSNDSRCLIVVSQSDR